MDQTLINNIVYYLIVALFVIIGFTIIISGIIWMLNDQINNIEKKRNSGLIFLIAVLLFYALRFGSIIGFSLFSNQGHGFESSTIVQMLRAIEILVLAFMPSFAIIQAYIYNYQFLITKKPDSKQRKKFYWVAAVLGTSLILLVIELLIRLF